MLGGQTPSRRNPATPERSRRSVARRNRAADANRPADGRDLRRMATISMAVVTATAIATAGVAGTGGAGGANAVVNLSGPSGVFTFDGPLGASPSPDPSRSAVPAITPSAPPAATPQLRITLAYERHDRNLALTLTFAGYVFSPYAIEGGQLMPYPSPAGRDIGLSEHLDWGDGTSYDAPVKAQRCPQGDEKKYVHEVKDTYQLKKKFRKPGDYTLSYRYVACGLTDGQIAGKLKLHVP
jgi:hypothetical protein